LAIIVPAVPAPRIKMRCMAPPPRWRGDER
jgi:hypothetical protein